MIRECYLEGELRVYYRKNIFKKNRKTLIFLHGLSSNSSAWFRFEKFFGMKYNIRSIDLRGHGKSYKPKRYGDYAIGKFAEDVENILKKEKLKRVILVCHSFSVFVGLELLKRTRGLIDSAVFLSPSYRAPADFISRIKKFFLNFRIIWEKIPLEEDYGYHFDYSKYEGGNERDRKRIAEDVKNTGLKVCLYVAKQSYNFDGRKILRKIDVPVLLVQGKKDSLFNYRDSIYMHENIRGSKLIILDEGTHVLVLNNFKEVSKIMEDFIKNKH